MQGFYAVRSQSIKAGAGLATVLACLALAGATRAADAPAVGLIDTPEKAKAAQQAWAEKLGKPVHWTNSVGMKFQLIPPGEFVMGLATGQPDETPHRVRITQPFYMGMTEVTRAQWEAVTEKVHSTYFPGPDHPINCVSWYHVKNFLAGLNKKETQQYRLPTEAEWEYAARGGSSTAYPTGDTEADLDKVGWYDKNSDNELHPVGQKAPNAFGLHDMNGNAWEWCEELYDPEYYKDSPADDPKGPAKAVYAYRSLRGGSALFGAAACRSTARTYYQTERYTQHFGFRIVLPITTETLTTAPAK